MWLIDRYIVRRFLANFIILLILLFVFAVSIDLLLELDEFVDVARATVGPDAGFLAGPDGLDGLRSGRIDHALQAEELDTLLNVRVCDFRFGWLDFLAGES